MRFDPLYTSTLAGSLNAVTGREQTLSNELSSGLRVSAASTDPASAAAALRLSASLAGNDAFTRSASTVQSRLQVADSTLGSAVTQITSAISLAVQAQNGTLSAADVSTIGTQIGSLRDEVLSLANTSYDGAYLFSGTATTTQPFSLDGSTGSVTYAGDSSTQQIATTSGQTLQAGAAGSALFTAQGASVLDSLTRLAADFSSGTVSSTAAADLEELRSGLSQLSSGRGALDASLSVLNNAVTYAAGQRTELQATQSSLVAADTTSVATQLSASETQGQALLSVIASTSKSDLFDYLK